MRKKKDVTVGIKLAAVSLFSLPWGHVRIKLIKKRNHKSACAVEAGKQGKVRRPLAWATVAEMSAIAREKGTSGVVKIGLVVSPAFKRPSCSQTAAKEYMGYGA